MKATILAKEIANRITNALGTLKGAPPIHLAQDDHRGPNEWRVTFKGRYATWTEAIESAGANAFPVVSKDYRASLRTTADDWDGYLKHHEVGLLAAVMAAMATTRSPQKTVVDFGGGYGIHFLTLLKVNLIPCKWEVVELEEVANLGAQKWRHNADLRFIENLESATKRPDLVIASGVFQYLADPYAYIRQIEALEPTFLFIDRLPLTNLDRDVCTIQRTGAGYFGVERTFPHWLISRDKFVADLARGFDLLFRFKGFQDAGYDEFEAEAIFLRKRAARS